MGQTKTTVVLFTDNIQIDVLEATHGHDLHRQTVAEFLDGNPGSLYQYSPSRELELRRGMKPPGIDTRPFIKGYEVSK